MNNPIEITSILFKNYSSSLIDRVYKILPLFEEKNEGLFNYVQSLIYELNGLYWVIESLKSNGDYLILLATLESISEDTLFCDEDDHSTIKREVFKCLDLVKKIKSNESGE